jgi:hypothetical protein
VATIAGGTECSPVGQRSQQTPTAPKRAASEESTVTELEELEETELQPIDEALALIDKGLGGLTERQLVSASEVADLLLDVRSLLSDSASATSA